MFVKQEDKQTSMRQISINFWSLVVCFWCRSFSKCSATYLSSMRIHPLRVCCHITIPVQLSPVKPNVRWLWPAGECFFPDNLFKSFLELLYRIKLEYVFVINKRSSDPCTESLNVNEEALKWLNLGVQEVLVQWGPPEALLLVLADVVLQVSLRQ